MSKLDVTPADLRRVADDYTELAARAATMSPEAADQIRAIADTHGAAGWPVAVGIAARLARHDAAVTKKIGDFGAYAQRLTSHAATYSAQDSSAAATYPGT